MVDLLQYYDNIAISLSGGAVRGAAHIGVLRALEEFGIKPNIVAGASAGSIIAAFYSAGYTPDEMEEIILKTKFFSYLKPKFPKDAFFSLEKMDRIFEEYIDVKDISQLKKKTYIVVVNLKTGEAEYIDRGDLKTYVRASCSLPVIFEPVFINGIPYIDGGIVDNLPVKPFLEYENTYIIGSEVNPLSPNIGKLNIFSIAMRSFFLAVRASIERNKTYCNLFIQPPEIIRIGLFETKKIKEAIDIGYNYTKKYLIKKFQLDI